MKYTREQILAMDAEQLRLAIAEAIEPKPVYIPNIALVLFEPQWSEKGAWFCTSIYSRGDIPMWLPRNYTGEISAAWELVEEMRLSGKWVAVDSTNNGWVCFAGSQSNDTEYWCSCDNHNEGDTALLAIARAWLMWKEGV